MRTIVLNKAGSSLNQMTEAVMLKAGYLLGDQIFTAGTTCYDLAAEEIMSELTIKQKLELLLNRYKDEPEPLKIFSQAKQTFKDISKIKHPPSTVIAAQKRMERYVHICWIELMNELNSALNNTGMGVMKQLRDNSIFGCYPIDDKNEYFLKSPVVACELLQLQLSDKDEVPEIFFLGAEFFKAEFEKPEIYEATDVKACQINNMYLNTCFTLPNINLLTATELQAVRQQLSTPGQAFRDATNKWIQACYNNTDAPACTTSFIGNVLPAAAVLQQSIEKNEILQHCSRLQHRLVNVEIVMGEIPVGLLWDFYKYHDAISDTSWSVLEKAKEESSIHLQRWPVMMLRAAGVDENTIQDNIADDDTDEVKSVKKAILID